MRLYGQTTLWALLFILIALHVGVWFSVRDIKARWSNVPPVPREGAVIAMALGDKQAAYRTTALMLQNLGNTGGRSEPFKNYDYNHLKNWFFLTHDLDQRSNLVPYLAAFYFGAVEDPEKLRLLVDYLAVAGQAKGGVEQWRWLAQAAYIARFKLHDLDLAYKFATELAALAANDSAMPGWAAQMPAFVLTEKGDKQAALEIMMNLLQTSASKAPVQEINFMRHYICTRLLDTQRAGELELCKDIKW